MLAMRWPCGSTVSTRRPSNSPPCFWKYHQGMPFWVVTTAVLSWNRAGISFAIGSTWCALSARITTSCLPASAILLVALTFFATCSAAVFLDQLQAVLLHGLEMRAARDQRDFLARERELGAHQTADGAGADDADLHGSILRIYLYSLDSVPMPSMTISTLLPGFIEPTPTEVPQQITSPGYSVMSREIRLTICAGLKIMSPTG